MAELTVQAPAKINLHLEVLGLRPDGFHELAMVMQSIDLLDALHLAPTADGTIRLECDLPDLPVDGTNLIVRAGVMLRQRSGLPELGARMRLEKRIPVGAGLAGGSSDGAAALVGLNALWGLGFSDADLLAMATELGSDMPFCLQGGTQLCFGRGEVLEELPQQDGAPLALLLLKHPGCSVSTPWAYRRCRELRGEVYLRDPADFEQRREALRRSPLVSALAIGTGFPPIRNDLQGVVEPEVESVQQGLELLRRCDRALAVAMSGSGPSLFAVFPDLESAHAAQAEAAGTIRLAGFDSWACSFRPRGVSLEP